MQNIIEICKEFGFEIPADKAADFNKKVSENYLTRAEHDKKIGKAEAERDTWKEKAETAEATLQGFEGIDPEKVQQELADWKKKAEDAEAEAEKKLYERDFADALKQEMEGYQFTSEAAKRDVMSQVMTAELKLKDGKILGLSDLMEQIRETDQTAFVDEEQARLEKDKARFTKPANGQTGAAGKGKVSMTELMKMKNENPGLDIAQYM